MLSATLSARTALEGPVAREASTPVNLYAAVWVCRKVSASRASWWEANVAAVCSMVITELGASSV